MKLVGAFILVLFAFIQNTPAQEETQSPHSWFCMADGYEPASGRKTQVSGPNKSTLKEAQSAAIQQCESLGLAGCTYSTCIDEGGY